MSTEDRRGLQRDGTNTSEFNKLHFATEQQIRNSINTGWIGRIDSVSTDDGGAPASGTVSATQMTAQSDAEGNNLPMASISDLPYARLQHGIAAIVINPVPGDLIAFSTCKRDISTIKQGADKPQRAGSYRQFDPADSIGLGAVHTSAPEVYIELTQAKKIYIKAPAGAEITTDATVTINASKVQINAPDVRISGKLTVTGDVVGAGISLSQHKHPGVRRGDSQTDPPV